MKKNILYILTTLLTVHLTAQTYQPSYTPNIATPADTVATDSTAADSIAAMPWPENVICRLDSLANDPLLSHSQMGLMVYDLTADSAIYCLGEKQTLRPASTMKLVTAITAIDKLGGGYQLRTSLYYTGEVADSTLTGDLYCVGGMDPRFNHDDMTAFVESLLKMGIDTIRGRIVADTSMKDDDRLGEGWCWDDDNPVLSPLLIAREDSFLTRFTSELRDAGICLDEAQCCEGTVPAGAYLVCHRFHSLDQILMKMMKESDNLYAEAVYYQLAASEGVRHATAKHARQHIRRLLNRLGVGGGSYKLADGSGLSLYNYVTADMMIRLLRYAWRTQNVYAQLYPTLPIAGVDGTLEKRMTKGPAKGNVRAKTGTLTGISSLAGYCTAANGHELAFCIINQGVLRNAQGRTFQDKVCTALCQP